MEQEIKAEIKRNIPRDLFLHLLAIVTLYWSAVSFVTLLWQYINYFFPDILNYYQRTGLNGPMRFAVSSLFIVFPVFILVSWHLNKIYAREYVVRESKIRKWLIYLTLFVASLVIIGDLVSVINTLLNGEIKIRFILKALSILFVAIVVFWYYLDDVRKETPTKLARYFASTSGLAVLIGVMGAFFIIGTPQTARLEQFDQQKVSDLQSLQYQIVNYWQRKEVLPNSLSDLNDPIAGYKAQIDSQTNQPYEYRIVDLNKLSFELCATFNKPASEIPAGVETMMVRAGQWAHKAGRVCFEREIDKQLYPPLNKNVK